MNKTALWKHKLKINDITLIQMTKGYKSVRHKTILKSKSFSSLMHLKTILFGST